MTDRLLQLAAVRSVPMLPGMTHLTLFQVWLQSWGAAETTVQSRIAVLTAFLRDLHPHDVTTLTEHDLGTWLAQDRFSAWTRATYYGHLRSFFGWARKTGLRPDDPTAELRKPKPPKNRPRPLTGEQTDRALDESSGWLRIWLLLGFYAGLRAHEIAKIRGEDVTRDAIFVLGKGGSEAFIPTHDLIWEIAQQMPRYGWWFPSARAATGHVNPKTVTVQTSRLFERLGIEGAHHRTRHTYGTDLLRAGVNIRVVQELMRHETLSSTEAYTEVVDDEKSAGIATLPTRTLSAERKAA